MNHLIAPQVIQFWEEKVRSLRVTMLLALTVNVDSCERHMVKS